MLESWRSAKIVALFMAAAALVGCQNRPEAASPVLAGNIDDGKAHVYVFLGTTDGVFFDFKNRRNSDFYVNGQDVGKIDSGDCLYLELEPGVYNFSWAGGWLLNSVRSDQDVDLLQPNQVAYLALDVDENAGSLAWLAGEFFDPNRAKIDDRFPNDRNLISGMKIIVPTSDVSSQIHPIVSSNTNLPLIW